jgi:hypothetical protein
MESPDGGTCDYRRKEKPTDTSASIPETSMAYSITN